MNDRPRTTPGPLALLIEDEPHIRRVLRASLASHGWRTVEAASGVEGLAAARQHVPDAVLLDLGLPDMDGLRVAVSLREWSDVPIIVLSARGQEADKVAALDAGADDYLTKPFGLAELLARLRVALRHSARVGADRIEHEWRSGPLRVDLSARRVFRDGAEVPLTSIEWRLLAELVKHAGKVLTHRRLLKAVWGPGHSEETHYLRVYMAHLRRKLEPDPTRPRIFRTETGVGYRLVEADAEN
ncbi:MAG: response regulator [Candidatus Methylomirabilis sp.]|nr:response regulator [Deltaproteobacteria bacterium]